MKSLDNRSLADKHFIESNYEDRTHSHIQARIEAFMQNVKDIIRKNSHDQSSAIAHNRYNERRAFVHRMHTKMR